MTDWRGHTIEDDLLHGTNGHRREPIGRLARDIEPEAVSWLWPGRLAVGKLTTCDGDPGLGKSTLTLEVAARLSRGDALPGGTEHPPMGAVLLNAEDGAADTIRPRLELAGADLARVYILEGVREADGTERNITLAKTLDAIETAITTHHAGLLVIDPLMAYLGGEVNSYRDQDVRGVLAPLQAMLDRTGCAAILVRHLNKAQSMSALYRGGASIGIIGAARFGWLVGRDPDDETATVVGCLKCNIGPEPKPWRYWLRGVEGSDHARVEWDSEPCTVTNQAMLGAEPEDPEERSALEEAEVWLLDALAFGARPSKELLREAEREGVAKKTLYRAKAKLKIEAKRESVRGSKGEGRWLWRMPGDSREWHQDGQGSFT